MVTIGIDEVGRGCWAGPLVAGAVVLASPIVGLRDSKKLTAKRRQALAVEIGLMAEAHALGWVEPAEVDELGITASVCLAMQRALDQIGCAYDEIIIDGNINFFPDNPKCRAVIKADDSVPAVSAASIIAKVARDAYMCEVAAKYPAYGFEKHVGYGTSLHQHMLELHGICNLHRKSYKPIQKIMAAST